MPSQITDSEFSLSQARRIVGDLFVPNERIFWRDFVAAMGTADLLFMGVGFLPTLLPKTGWAAWGLQDVGFVIYSFLYYRCAMFIHELVHIRSDRFTEFCAAWNLFCGTVFLTPTFVYYTHLDHHRRKDFGTKRDGEYMPLACRPRWEMIGFLMQSFVIWLPELWAPTGTRFHSLHHMLPALPYHAMREAHEHLMRDLPDGALYRQTNEDSLWSALRYLWLRNDMRPSGNEPHFEEDSLRPKAATKGIW